MDDVGPGALVLSKIGWVEVVLVEKKAPIFFKYFCFTQVDGHLSRCASVYSNGQFL